MTKCKRNWFTIVIPVVTFGLLALCFPVGIANDSQQFMTMHIHRDPLYCLFLWVLRLCFGENNDFYLQIAKWLQNILAAVSAIFLTNTVSKTYLKSEKVFPYSNQILNQRMVFIIEILISFLCVSPHIITPFASQTRLILSNSILSESITLPLFYFYIGSMILMIESERIWDKYSVFALLTAWLLSLARGQMMVMIIAYLIVKIIGCIRKSSESKVKLLRDIAFVLATFVISFGLRFLTVNTYNLVFNGHFMGTAYSDVTLLTNVLYASDSDAEQLIEDEKARRFFSIAKAKMDECGYSYLNSDEGFLARGEHLESHHDDIKFECIEECWREIHHLEGGVFSEDYVLEAIEQDRVASVIFKSIVPSCFGRWLYNYLALCVFGFVRTVAIMNVPFLIYAVLIYLFIAIFVLVSFRCSKGDEHRKILRLALFTLLTVCANVCGTATVIMCLSRYMIYCLPLVYILLVLIANMMLKKYLSERY